MPPKNEICRYFQRGSCQYGTRCKFVHPTQQQTQTNPFGFGKQTGTQFQDTRQPVPNPFGFGSKSNQPKPFENKWSRGFSPINNSSASASRKPDNQPKAANHKCTDPESCKRMMLEDLGNERPLWKLTCYGHSQNGPCEIVGDISYDELRALAYDDYKHGKSLQAIVERERNMLNSKITEFENLVQKPYTVSSASTPSSQNVFAGVNKNAPFANNGSSAQVSSFSQLSASLNTRSAAAPNYDFGQASALQSNSQPSSWFQMNNSPFNSSGTFVSQPQPIQSASPFDTTKPSNGGASLEQNPFSAFANSSQTGSGVDKQLNFFNKEPSLGSSAIGQSIIGIQSINTFPKENTDVDGSIWTKPEWKWNVGEKKRLQISIFARIDRTDLHETDASLYLHDVFKRLIGEFGMSKKKKVKVKVKRELKKKATAQAGATPIHSSVETQGPTLSIHISPPHPQNNSNAQGLFFVTSSMDIAY